MFLEVIPGEVAQPRMVLYFARAVQAQPVCGFPLDESVHEIGTLNAPASRYFMSFNLYLLCQNMVSNFLTSLANIRSLHSHNINTP
jgi:hypothetical protein